LVFVSAAIGSTSTRSPSGRNFDGIWVSLLAGVARGSHQEAPAPSIVRASLPQLT
jgi:hypothetical protein